MPEWSNHGGVRWKKGSCAWWRYRKRMLSDLWLWDREVLGELERRIKNSRRELERCRRRGINRSK